MNELVATISRVLNVPLRRNKIPVRPVLAAAWLTERLCRPCGIEPPLHTRRVAFFTKHRGFSIAKAKRDFDYAPKVDLDEGIAMTTHWYRENGLLY